MASRFAVKGSLFAHVSVDNRLHLWDASNRKQRKSYVDKNHLSHSFTCTAWHGASQDKPGIIAVGFSDGIVIVWDLTRGVITKTLGTPNESPPVTDVVFSKDGKSLFASSLNTQILHYDLATGVVLNSLKGGKKGVSKLAMNPKLDVLAACSSSIKLLDIASGRKKKLEASFAGGVSAAIFTPCGGFLAAVGAKSREVLIFDVRTDAPVTPVYVIPVKSNVTALDARCCSPPSNGSGNGKGHGNGHSVVANAFEVLAIYDQSGACLMRLSSRYKENAQKKINSVLGTTDIKASAPITAGSLSNSGSSSSVSGGECTAIFAVGSQSQPLFKSVSFTAAAINCHAQHDALPSSIEIDIGADNAHGELSAAASASAGAAVDPTAPDVLGPHEMGGRKRPVVDGDDQPTTKKSKKDAAGPGAESLLSLSEGTGGEQSLQQRLESLSSTMAQLEDFAQGKGDLVPFAGSIKVSSSSGAASTSAAGALTGPTSDSLVTLVDQALQSGDDALLEQCLTCTDAAIVEETARRLSAGRIVLFLRKLLAKFEKRPSRSMLLTHWLSSLLRHHTAYLVTLPDLSFQLAGLSQMLEQRLTAYMKLSALAGRLDLLMSQVSYNTSGANSAQQLLDQQQSFEPKQVYNEDDDDDEEEEDEEEDDDENDDEDED